MSEQVQQSSVNNTQSIHAPPVLCAGGCGFFGNPRTSNLCSKCHLEHQKKSEGEKKSELLVSAAAASASASAAEVEAASPSSLSVSSSICSSSVSSVSSEHESPSKKKEKSRCHVCSKRVGLNFFKCRCDSEFLFCSTHRLPHSHSCTFNIKALHQHNLSKQNPEIKKDKFEKIWSNRCHKTSHYNPTLSLSLCIG